MKNKILKVRKRFDYQGIELRIVEREEFYSNSKEPVVKTRVLAPNGGNIPYTIKPNELLKDIIYEVTWLLDSFAERGADVKEELTKEI